jgi:hypothetical protein
MGGAMALVGSSLDESVVCTVGLAASGIGVSEEQPGDEKAIAAEPDQPGRILFLLRWMITSGS